ncbi:MAG: OsmC family protein [Bacteroidia bacterium]
MERTHHFKATVTWTGNKGEGTTNYKAYDRYHTVKAEGKPEIACCSDPAFLGDGSKYNPEDFLISALSSCHMLWYLHLCADAGVIVTDYKDQVEGLMQENPGGGGQFSEVTLNPLVTVADASMVDKANALHVKAREKCFIANSCNFPVKHKATCIVK